MCGWSERDMCVGGVRGTCVWVEYERRVCGWSVRDMCVGGV